VLLEGRNAVIYGGAGRSEGRWPGRSPVRERGCLNVTSHGDVQGTPMVEMSVEDYLRPVESAVRTTFLTSTAAGRHMAASGRA
jgi:hypothetical protein